jgi:glycosyltransferase involved in cell wall biosynthesis
MARYARLLLRHLERAPGVQVRAVTPPGAGRLARYLGFALSARRQRAAVHHVLDHGNAHLLRALVPERTVVTCHDLIPLLAARGVLPRSLCPPRVRAIFGALTRALPRARLILTPSATTARDLIHHLGCDPARIRVIPLGLDDPVPAPQGRLALGPRPRVLSVGVAYPYKNLPGTLRAFARLRGDFPSATLVRVGAPLPRAELALAARLGVLPALRELGWLGEPELAAAYAQSDLLFFPSFYEGFGWPPLEAMAAGLPVVAAPAPAIREVCGDAARYAPADDPVALAAAAAALLSDEDVRTRQIERGRTRAAGYCFRDTARRTVAAYRAVAEA